MRLLLLVDPLIPAQGLLQLEQEFAALYKKHTDITPEFLVEPFAYKDIPLEPDKDGDLKPTYKWLKETTARYFKRYRTDIDHVVYLVHQDNWIYKGIWGSSWSNHFSGYQVELSRFDKKNPANSLGTLYHEVHHSHDAFIKTMLGVDVNPIVGVTSWDGDITHGGRDTGAKGWAYIRHTENTLSLELIAPYLRDAYAKRRELWNAEKRKMLEQILVLAQQTLVLLRAKLNKKVIPSRRSLK